jgi:hypothetical protein
MIHHQNADAMVLASALASARLRGIPPPLDWLGPWRQHLMTNYGLRQNHRKNQEVGLLCTLFCGKAVSRQLQHNDMETRLK